MTGVTLCYSQRALRPAAVRGPSHTLPSAAGCLTVPRLVTSFTISSSTALAIASYVGLARMPFQSGGIDRDRKIRRAGNPRTHTAIIQFAVALVPRPGGGVTGTHPSRKLAQSILATRQLVRD